METHKEANKTWADKYTKVQGLKPKLLNIY